MNLEDFDAEDYDVDDSVQEYAGFTVGDTVVVISDSPDGFNYFEGEEAIVIGFSARPEASDPAMAERFGNDPSGGTDMILGFDGQDPKAIYQREFSNFEVI